MTWYSVLCKWGLLSLLSSGGSARRCALIIQQRRCLEIRGMSSRSHVSPLDDVKGALQETGAFPASLRTSSVPFRDRGSWYRNCTHWRDMSADFTSSLSARHLECLFLTVQQHPYGIFFFLLGLYPVLRIAGTLKRGLSPAILLFGISSERPLLLKIFRMLV